MRSVGGIETGRHVAESVEVGGAEVERNCIGEFWDFKEASDS